MIHTKKVEWVIPVEIMWSWDETRETKHGAVGSYMRLGLFVTEYIDSCNPRIDLGPSAEKIKEVAKKLSRSIFYSMIPCPECGEKTEPVLSMEGNFLCRACAWGPEELKFFDWSAEGYWFSQADELMEKMKNARSK